MQNKLFLMLLLSLTTNIFSVKEDHLNKKLMRCASGCLFFNVNNMQDLINKGASNINEALCTAAICGNLPAVETLLRNGANPNCIVNDKRDTILTYAAKDISENRNISIVLITLLKAGIDINIENNDHETFISLNNKNRNDPATGYIVRELDKHYTEYLEYLESIKQNIIESIPGMPADLANIIAYY